MHYTQRGVGARRTEFCLCRAPIISSTKQHSKVTIQTIASLHNIAACDLVVLNKVYTFQNSRFYVHQNIANRIPPRKGVVLSHFGAFPGI